MSATDRVMSVVMAIGLTAILGGVLYLIGWPCRPDPIRRITVTENDTGRVLYQKEGICKYRIIYLNGVISGSCDNGFEFEISYNPQTMSYKIETANYKHEEKEK